MSSRVHSPVNVNEDVHARTRKNSSNSANSNNANHNKVNFMEAALNLLMAWDLAQLCETFKEQEVCITAFRHLSDADIEQLIPKIGPRSIFRAMLADWRREQAADDAGASPTKHQFPMPMRSQQMPPYGMVKLEASSVENQWPSNDKHSVKQSPCSPEPAESAQQQQRTPPPLALLSPSSPASSVHLNRSPNSQMPANHYHHPPIASHHHHHHSAHPHIQITGHSMPPNQLLPPNIPIIMRTDEDHPNTLMDTSGHGHYHVNKAQSDEESEAELTVEADLTGMSQMEDDEDDVKFNEVSMMENQSTTHYVHNSSGNGSATKTTHRIDVRQLLANNLDGIKAFEYYRERGELDSIHRKRIVRIVISTVLEQCIIMSTHSFTDLANQVVQIFPTEIIETYYVPRTGTICPKGALYNKYLNMGKQMRRKGILEYRVPRRMSNNRSMPSHI